MLLISDATWRSEQNTLSPPFMPRTDIRSGDRLHVTAHRPSATLEKSAVSSQFWVDIPFNQHHSIVGRRDDR